MSDVLVAFMAVVALALVHVGAGRLHFLAGVPRSRVLSAAGGVSVAYVFVHLLPEIAEGQEAIEESTAGLVAGIERHAYVVALVGLAVFYGVERLTVASKASRRERGLEQGTDAAPFAVSVGSFAVYNAVIGYLMLERAEVRSGGELALFAVALGLHFVVNDYGLREHHDHQYQRLGRWVLAAAVIAGWAVGLAVTVSEAAIAVIIAFIGGGVVLNVLKEELPERRASRFPAFALGAAAYATILLAI